MKRRIASDLGPTLKRRSSSLFSIDTINESPSRVPSELNLTQASIEDDPSSLRVVSLYPFDKDAAESTEVSSASDGGFYIDDEELEESDNDDLGKTTTANQLVPTFATKATLDVEKKPEHLQTGLVFEAAPKHFDRYNRLHKERPVRVTSIMQALQNSTSIKDKFTILDDNSTQQQDTSPESVFLEDDDYLQVHLPGYMKRLDKLSSCTCCEKLDREAEQFKSIYLTQDSVREAKIAATSLCKLVTKVVQGDLHNGFAVIRPPGHHAEPSNAGGYCVINNVAVAAAYAREKLSLNKILIVDWDVHHGNGTQSIFLNDPNILYFSVHRWHGGNFFPFLQHGGPTNIGKGEGEGFNVNVGWSRKGMGNDEYLAVWETLLMPIAREFQPDLVLVSAGFDAAQGDMGECNVTPECFGRLTRSLMTLADGKVVCALEGGYVRSVLAKCVESVVSNLLDRNSAELAEQETKEAAKARDGVNVLDTIDATAAKNIRSTITAHKGYWSCLKDEESK